MFLRKKNIVFNLLCILYCILTTNLLFAQEKQENLLTFDMMQQAGEYYNKGQEFYKQRKFDKAGEAFAQSFETLKTNKEAAYHAAASYALAKNTEKSLHYLEKAIKTGWYEIENDPDFASVKSNSRFQELLQLAKNLKEKMLTQSIEPLFILPNNYDKTKAYPLLIAFHGFNENPQEFAAHYTHVANKHNMILMLCRGTKIIAFNSFAWTYEQEEYERVLEEIEIAQLKHNILPGKIILSGYSQGANFAYALGMVFSQQFSGILPVAGTLPSNVTIAKMKNKKLRIYSIIGLRDNPNIVEQNRQAQKKFEEHGFSYKLQEFDIGHGFPPDKNNVLSDAIEWLLNK